jgi:hypothetical protein
VVWFGFEISGRGNENRNQRGQKAIQLIYLLFVSFVLTMRSRGQDRMALSRGGT